MISLLLKLLFSSSEFIIALLVIGLAITVELINTAIEYTVDMAMPEIHPLAKNAKDLSAGAVFIMDIFILVIGIIIYLPKK